MNQPRPLGLAKAQRVEQPVEMALGFRPALDRETRRLVEHDDRLVAVDDRGLHHRLRRAGGTWRGAALGGGAVSSNGGMRIAWPGVTRSPALARLPSIRICPVRSSFSNRPCPSAG